MPYAPLQVISSYSLLHSTISIPELVQVAKQRGYQSLCLTDHNVMYGAIEFYNECLKQHLHPVIGLTLSLTGLVDPAQHDIILLAQNKTGYQNLLKLSTAKMTGDQLTFTDLAPHLAGLQLITPLQGELRTLMQNNDLDPVNRYLKRLAALNLAGLKIGVSPQDDPQTLHYLKEWSQRINGALVALDPVRYLNPEDYFTCHVMEAIDSGSKMVSPLQDSHQVGRQWLKPNDKITNEFARRDLMLAVQNGERLVQQCQLEIEKRPTQLPHFQNDAGMDSKSYLLTLCQKGLKRRYQLHQIDARKMALYQERLTKELKLINDMGFTDYFLIVWDVINYAHQVKIMTGPGRGSAAGSLVSYVLFITDVDPIHYDLLFERFLNPERAQMPDIDLDIPDDKRDTILQYVHDKYGDDRVAQIITFGTFGAKQALRDVGRVFGLPPAEINTLSKTVPSDLHISLTQAYQKSQNLRNLVHDSTINRLIFTTAQKLAGLPRHTGTHAAGLILSDVPLVDLSPLQTGNEHMKITQYAKTEAEEVGLLKIDFLGLRNLSTLAQIIALVHRHRDANFDIHQINLNDPMTLQLFQKGDTNGVFQFESSGIKRVLRELQPNNFNLVAAVDALYRPGPMQNIDTFIKRRQGKEKVTYPAPELKSILAPTFGIIVYQEQVMQVASVMGGFTLGQADILRRAMSKKKHQVMDSMRTQFIKGAKQKGFSEAVANQTFDYIDQFASYGFNKSHAVAYSKMAFELAYLKVHASMEFFTAILNNVIGNDLKLRTYVQEIKQRQLAFSGPNINFSDADFNIKQHRIFFGLNDIRGLRSDLITEIITLRKQNGLFKDLDSFLHRLDPKFRKVKLIEPLIDSGALDCFGYHRAELDAALPEFIESINLSGDSVELLQVLKPKIHQRPEWSTGKLLERERASLGVYLSKYPVEQYDDVRSTYQAVKTNELDHIEGLLTMVLYVIKVKTIRTKTGQPMAFLRASDENGEVDLVLFPSTYRQAATWLHDKMVIFIRGKLETDRGQQVVINQLQPAANVQSNLKKQANRHCYLRLDQQHDNLRIKRQLYQIISNHRGPITILLYQPRNDSKQILGDQYAINADLQTIKLLNQLLGRGNVIFTS